MLKFNSILLLLCCADVMATNNQTIEGAGPLYDNGPIISSIGTGVGGADESVLENNNLSMTSFGTAHHPGANLRVAEDFIIAESPWQIDSIDFYAYQTNETASTITSINLKIWDGVPNAIDSTVVFGDSSNVLNTTSEAGILRVNEDTQGTTNNRQIAISNVQINRQFSPGTYWLDWQSDGSGSSGPFVPHITIPGQNTTGNALLSTNNGATFSALLDLGSQTNQGLPFVINGSVTAGPQTQSVPTMNWLGSLLLIVMIVFIMNHINRLKQNN